MRPQLAETLSFLHALSERAGVAPVLFGTAVLELKGIGDFCASDLDVITGVEEAKALASAAGIDPGGEGGDDKFRSVVHLHLSGAPLVIDVMADMSVRVGNDWLLYEVLETEEIEAGGNRFRAVSPADLLRFYRLADRTKDDAKIAALSALLA